VPRLKGNPFVICGERPGAHLVNLQKAWRRIRGAAGLEDVRIHDLRHTFASWGASGGLPLPILGGLLSHSQAQTTKRYAHLSADPLRAASENVAQALAAAMGRSKNR
jgi:integrase